MNTSKIAAMPSGPATKRSRIAAPANLKSPRQVLLVSLFLGWCVDWLFYGKTLGISWPLFFLLWWLALWRIGRFETIRPARRNLWLLIPLFFFAIMVSIRANPFLTTLNVLATLALLSYIVFFYAAGRVEALETIGVLLLPLRVGMNGLLKAPQLINEGVDVWNLRRKGWRYLWPVCRGALLASPVLLVFTVLLASADLVFADHLDELFRLEFLTNLGKWLWRSVLILMSAWFLTGGFMIAFSRRASDEERSSLENALGSLPRTLSLGFVETGTLLGLVNGLFLAFTAVQFTYLFGGTSNIDAAGYTYAEYARRGFFELVTVAVLSLALILGLNWLTRRESKRQIRWFNILGSLMVSFVLLMLLSAFRRMQLYEATFGYTEMRLYVYVFMIWMGLLLGWFLLTLWKRPDRFAIGFIMAAIGYLATLNLINPDAFIVRQNLARYLQTNDLDAAYLTRLSDDAVPQLMRGWQLVKGEEQLITTPDCAFHWGRGFFDYVDENDDACQATPATIIGEELRGRLQEKQEDASWRRWQSFHLSRRQAFAAMQGVG